MAIRKYFTENGKRRISLDLYPALKILILFQRADLSFASPRSMGKHHGNDNKAKRDNRLHQNRHIIRRNECSFHVYLD